MLKRHALLDHQMCRVGLLEIAEGHCHQLCELCVLSVAHLGSEGVICLQSCEGEYSCLFSVANHLMWPLPMVQGSVGRSKPSQGQYYGLVTG